MKRINALKLRQTFGAVLDEMESSTTPLVVEKNSKPLAVLIPYSEFKKRFVDLMADAERKELVQKFRDTAEKVEGSSLEILRSIRYAQDR